MARIIKDLNLPVYLVTQDGGKINIINPKTLKTLGTKKLPHAFKKEYSHECKNCQVSESEIAIGDNAANVFIYDLTKEEPNYRNLPPKVTGVNLISATSSHYSVSRKWNVVGENRLFVAGGEECVIYLWDLKDRKLVKEFSDHKDWVNDLLFISKDIFASASSDTYVYSVERLKLIRQFKENADGGDSYCMVYALSGSNDLLFSGNDDVSIYDLRQMKRANKITSIDHVTVHSLCFLEDCNVLISAGNEGWICLSDLRNLKKFVSKEKIHKESIRKVVDSRGIIPNTVISGSTDKYLKIYDIVSQKVLLEKKGENQVWGQFLHRTDNSSVEQAKRDYSERVEFLLRKEEWLNFRVSLVKVERKFAIYKTFLS